LLKVMLWIFKIIKLRPSKQWSLFDMPDAFRGIE
jgi:hypothetical protein